jgi:surface antigen
MRGTSRMVLLACFLAMVSTESYAESYADFDPWGPLGVALTKQDLQEMSAVAKPLLNDDSLPIGVTREWSNAKSGNRGTIQLLKRFEYEYKGSKLPCREIRYHLRAKGSADPYNYRLNRCRLADGSWKIL